MKRESSPMAAAVPILILSAMAMMSAAAAAVEHTFVVSQVNMTRLCNEMLVTVVNGQLPGPTIEVTEGDSVTVHVVNKSPYNLTIHWHGVLQPLNCWNDGVPMITQRPILPNNNFTYRFDVAGQVGTLWWHAHQAFLRGTVHGALIIRPKDNGTGSYPFPKPHREIPIVIGEWWEIDFSQVDRNFNNGNYDDVASGSTINGKLGDLFNCSGVMEDGYVLDVEPGKTYLLRVINAALFSEYFLKIAGHKFMVVAADANYVNPYTTDVIAIAPGETVDALVVADAAPGRYYMVALPIQAPLPDAQTVLYTTRGMVEYSSVKKSRRDDVRAVAPEMPDQHDMVKSFYFHGNLSSLRPERTQVPVRAHEHLFITLGLGSICRRGGQSCNRRDNLEYLGLANMNNISFHLSAGMTTPFLEAHYYGCADAFAGTTALPDQPPRVFNYTDGAFIVSGPEVLQLEPTSRATIVRRFKHGTTVDVVFQGTSILQSESNPMHLHGHDMFVLAQGHGNYDAARDVGSYNLVNPPRKNTVLVPHLGWAAVRFVADNPGTWFMHCHFEFHLSMGMAAVFIVEDGPTEDTSLPPPPRDFLDTSSSVSSSSSGGQQLFSSYMVFAHCTTPTNNTDLNKAVHSG